MHPTRLIRDPDDELVAREDPTAPYVVTAHVAEGPDAARGRRGDRARAVAPPGVRPPARRRRSRSAASTTPTGPRRGRSTTSPQRIGRVVIVPSWIRGAAAAGEVRHHPRPRDGLRDRAASRRPAAASSCSRSSTRCRRGSSTSAVALGSCRSPRCALGADGGRRPRHRRAGGRGSRANAERNGVADRFDGASTARCRRRPGSATRSSLANLVAALLVELAPSLAAHLAPRGAAGRSGIIEPRASEVVDAMRAAGLAVTERRDDGEWVRLRLARAA